MVQTTTSKSGKSTAAPATWRVLGMGNGKLYFSAPEALRPREIVLEGIGTCSLAEDPTPLLRSTNLIDDAAFEESSPQLGWKANPTRLDRIGLSTSNCDPIFAPGSGRALHISVPAGDKEKAGFFFLFYADRRWGREIPVMPGETCTLTARFKGKVGRIETWMRFADQNSEPIASPITQSQHGFAGSADSPQNIVELTTTGVAPSDAAYAFCVFRIEVDTSEIKGDEAVFEMAEPMFTRREQTAKAGWHPRLAVVSKYLAALDTSDEAIWSVPYTAAGAHDQALNFHVRGEDTPRYTYELPTTLPEGELKIGEINGRTLHVDCDGHSGPVVCEIDGEAVSWKYLSKSRPSDFISIPDHYLDGDAHRIVLRSPDTLQPLAKDFLRFPGQTTSWDAIRTHCAPPLPSVLSPAARDWMRAMEGQIERFSKMAAIGGQDRWLLDNLPRLYQVLVHGFEKNRDFAPLRFPVHDSPKVSIVVPVHGKYPATYHCLASLLFASNETNFEVIVVDDGSSDETVELLPGHEGIEIVRREEAGGFVIACNEGAERATGDYVLFLNNDTEVTAGWLDELVRTFEIFPNTGAACSKLLFPDGRLQDAGGIIYRNGQPTNYGGGENAADPRYNYSRDADYLTGAALITPLSVWKEIGGFAEELAPAYFEDTWYSFAVRELGMRTIYCAPSKVYHTRGVSNGDDVSTETGLKRFQTINHPKFKRRWAQRFAHHGEPRVDIDLQKDRTARGRVLFTAWDFPRPDQSAGDYAIMQDMLMFRALGFKVTYLAENLKYFGRYTEDLQRLGIECVYAPFAMSAQEFLERRGGEFDIIWVNYHFVLDRMLPAIRRHAPQAKIALSLQDLQFLREMRRAIFEGSAAGEKRAHKLRATELKAMSKADLVVSYSGFEVEMVRGLVGRSPAAGKIQWVQPVTGTDKDFAEREGLCFLGSFRHPPNAEAVSHFARTIAPMLPDGPQDDLHVYGSNWDLFDAGEAGTVKIEGFAEDLGEVFDRHRIFVAPLKTGAGVKGKVLMALAHGIPTILSPVAAEAIGVTSGHDCLIADSDEEWVDAIRRLSTDEELWRQIRDNGYKLLEADYAQETGIEKLRELLEKIDVYV